MFVDLNFCTLKMQVRDYLNPMENLVFQFPFSHELKIFLYYVFNFEEIETGYTHTHTSNSKEHIGENGRKELGIVMTNVLLSFLN